MGLVSFGTESGARRKRVKYVNASGSSVTLNQGEPMCYNQDVTTNILGYSDSEGGGVDCQTTPTTTGEGYQNEAKFLQVENPASGNTMWFAGPICPGSWCGTAVANGAEKWIEVYVPNGAIVPIRTSKSCTIGDTVGIAEDSRTFDAVTGDGDPLPVAMVEETVDRSSTNGLVLAKLFPTGQQITATSAYFAPVRSSATSGREYGVKISGDSFFTGTTAAQSYLLELTGDKESITTGDGYSAYLHISGSNYAANDSSYTYRGLNCSISNRSGGTLGQMYGGNIAISLKSGSGNLTEAVALQVDAQDLTAGTKTKFGGLDVALNREGTAATEEFGMRLRTRGTINTAVNTVFRVDKDATDHGFVNLFNIEADAVDYAACTGDVTVTSSDKVIPIVLGGTTYYLIAVDGIPGA